MSLESALAPATAGPEGSSSTSSTNSTDGTDAVRRPRTWSGDGSSKFGQYYHSPRTQYLVPLVTPDPSPQKVLRPAASSRDGGAGKLSGSPPLMGKPAPVAMRGGGGVAPVTPTKSSAGGGGASSNSVSSRAFAAGAGASSSSSAETAKIQHILAMQRVNRTPEKSPDGRSVRPHSAPHTPTNMTSGSSGDVTPGRSGSVARRAIGRKRAAGLVQTPVTAAHEIFVWTSGVMAEWYVCRCAAIV